jgi:hypothetical protein
MQAILICSMDPPLTTGTICLKSPIPINIFPLRSLKLSTTTSKHSLSRLGISSHISSAAASISSSPPGLFLLSQHCSLIPSSIL